MSPDFEFEAFAMILLHADGVHGGFGERELGEFGHVDSLTATVDAAHAVQFVGEFLLEFGRRGNFTVSGFGFVLGKFIQKEFLDGIGNLVRNDGGNSELSLEQRRLLNCLAGSEGKHL